MGKIHKLSPALADMIAAGEVVERPASAVKELVENAIDAGATQILVEIKNGGITFMRVTDNGCGMAPEDAPTAFLRHATSKISAPEDLNGIVTMGFRGEALAAVCAVSKIELLTKSADADNGISVRAEAGSVLDVAPAGCPQGTTIVVRNLFYNTPARMKFLKRDSVEGGYVSGAVQQQALGHPEISFRFIRDGKVEFTTPGDGNLLSVIYAVLGRQAAKEMTRVQGTSAGVTISGYAGKPTANRGSRSFQYFFVNGRYVKSRMMSLALEEAYKNQMMTGRFPICVLHITVPAAAVDVNVHPAKTEVKFLRESDVFDAIHYMVLGALRQTPDRPEMAMPKQKVQPQPAANPAFYQTMDAREYREKFRETGSRPAASPAAGPDRTARPVPDNSGGRDRARPAQAAPERPSVRKPEAPAPAPEREIFKPEPSGTVSPGPVQTSVEMPDIPRPEMPAPEPEQISENRAAAPYRIIGQTMETYILVEQGDELLLIDKHAAHERILFERLKEQPGEIMSQILLSPIPAQLSAEERAELLEQTELLEQLGFTIEDCGTVLIRAIPADIDEQDAAACLSEIARDIREGRQLDPKTVRDNILHTIACKAAIKGGRKTGPQEISALVAELMRRDDIKYCPHGRPVCITLTRSHLERQFKRA